MAPKSQQEKRHCDTAAEGTQETEVGGMERRGMRCGGWGGLYVLSFVGFALVPV